MRSEALGHQKASSYQRSNPPYSSVLLASRVLLMVKVALLILPVFGTDAVNRVSNIQIESVPRFSLLRSIPRGVLHFSPKPLINSHPVFVVVALTRIAGDC